MIIKELTWFQLISALMYLFHQQHDSSGCGDFAPHSPKARKTVRKAPRGLITLSASCRCFMFTGRQQKEYLPPRTTLWRNSLSSTETLFLAKNHQEVSHGNPFFCRCIAIFWWWFYDLRVTQHEFSCSRIREETC